jgi:O-antigen/teichoic acid export membrane protein
MTVLIDCASDAAFTHLSTKKGQTQAAFDTVMTARAIVFVGLAALLGAGDAMRLFDVPWQTFVFLLPAFNLGILFEFHRSNIRFAAIICVEKIALLLVNLALLSFLEFGVAVYVSYAAVSLVSLIVQAYAHRGHIRALRPATAPAMSTYALTYWPLFLIAIAQLGYGNLSRLVIEGKHGIVVFAAVSLAFQVIALASILQGQVDRSFRLPIIEAVRIGDVARLRHLTGQYLTFATLPMVLATAIVFALAPQLIKLLFGPEYELAGRVLREISPLFISVSLMRLTDLILLALDLIKQSLAINLGVSLLMLLLMLSVPASKPLSLLTAIVVVAQYGQALLSGALATRTLRRRFA